jgi:hypothetical protein
MFDWPVGLPLDRAAAIDRLPGKWENNNPYGAYYQIAPGIWNYHDGVDLNLNSPDWNGDWHKPLGAIADGMVTFAGPGGGSWGHVVDIKHPWRDTYVVSRFGHIENPLVKRGDSVVMGQQVASVGNGDGYYGQSGAHCHWNISSPGDPIMLNTPNQWCGTSLACVKAHYIDPIQFIIDRKKEQMTTVVDAVITATLRVPCYQVASLNSPVVRYLKVGNVVQVDSAAPKIDPDSGIKLYPTPDDVWLAEDCLTFAVSRSILRYVSASATPWLNVRKTGDKAGLIIGKIAPGSAVQVDLTQVSAGGYAPLVPGPGWVSVQYLSTSPPVPPTKRFDPGYGPQFLYGKYDSSIARRYKYVKVISNPGALADAYQPGGLYIHRTFYEGSIADYINARGGTPDSAADHWMTENAEALAICPMDTVHEGLNEQTLTDLEVAFEIARLIRLKAMKRKGCVLNRGVGWTSDDLWKRSDMGKLLALVQETGSIVGVHCYGMGVISSSSGSHYWRRDNGQWSVPGDPLPATIDPTQSFHATRVVRDMQVVKALGFDVQFVATELGCDNNGEPYPHGIATRGWKSCIPIWQAEGWLSGIDAGSFYLKQLKWWSDITGIPGLVYGVGDTTDAEHYPPGVFDVANLL